MNENFGVLSNCSLFKEIDRTEFAVLLDELNASKRTYRRDEVIFAAGERATEIGVVLSGSICVSQEDYWGNRTILSAVDEGDIFGEAFCCSECAALPVTVTAMTDTEILLLDGDRLTDINDRSGFKARLATNLMRVLAEKNIALTRKIRHITKKTTREKVMSYLSECAAAAGKSSFAIPFDRQQLADYLSVDRSALSVTLCKMRDDHLICFRKNEFTVLHLEDD